MSIYRNYQILYTTATTAKDALDDLEEMVNNALNEDFTLIGGVSIVRETIREEVFGKSPEQYTACQSVAKDPTTILD